MRYLHLRPNQRQQLVPAPGGKLQPLPEKTPGVRQAEYETEECSNSPDDVSSIFEELRGRK